MKRGADPRQIQLHAEVFCGCGRTWSRIAACTVLAARLLRADGWHYVERAGRWGWCCPGCAAGQAAAETRCLREAMGVRP